MSGSPTSLSSALYQFSTLSSTIYYITPCFLSLYPPLSRSILNWVFSISYPLAVHSALCTCNSLTFLAFLYESENITSAELNQVLDKGNVMYKEARKRFPDNDHLATDELPAEVPPRSAVYDVDLTELSR